MLRLLTMGLMVAVAAPVLAAQPADFDKAEKTADNRDKMVCKRFVETGSLVKGYRTCKTKWEWERERENLRVLSVSDSCRLRGDGGAC